MRFVDASVVRMAVLLSVLLLSAFAANAQTTPELQTYKVESIVPLDQIGATPAPMLPVNVLQALQSGALEIRNSVIFTASTRTLSVRTFLVAPGSPNPTPPAGQTMMSESYQVNVENILWAPATVMAPGSARSTLVITGRIAGGAQSFVGDVANKLYVHSVGMNGTTATTFDNVTSLVAGMYTMYVSTAPGSINESGGVTPPPVDPDAPVAVATAGNNSTTVLSQIQLDASGSTDPGGGVLSYSWRFIGKTAAIIGPNSATPSVQFAEGFGDYVFEVTVSNAKGLSDTAEVKVKYLGR